MKKILSEAERKKAVREMDEEIKIMLFKEIEYGINHIKKYSQYIDRPDKVIESYNKIKKIFDTILGEYTDEYWKDIEKQMNEEKTGLQEIRMEIRARGTCKMTFIKAIEKRWPHPKSGVELDTVLERRNMVNEILHAPFSLDDMLRMLPRKKPEPKRGKIYIDF